MAGLLAAMAPVYFRNLQLQNYVADLTHSPSDRTKSDDVLRTLVLDRAHQLALPVMAGNVLIQRLPDGNLQRVDVRYFVQVVLPGYSVNLHFHPGAGGR